MMNQLDLLKRLLVSAFFAFYAVDLILWSSTSAGRMESSGWPGFLADFLIDGERQDGPTSGPLRSYLSAQV